MPQRVAAPGVFKLPQGAAERERFRALDARVTALEKAISALTARLAESEPKRKPKGEQP